MSSVAHDFIVASLVRKARQLGYEPICLDARHKDTIINRPPIPPRIVRHRPDAVAAREDGSFCICEAKTAGDVDSDRTRAQIADFHEAISVGNCNLLLLGTSLKGKPMLRRLLMRMGLLASKHIITIYIPEGLLPDEEEI